MANYHFSLTGTRAAGASTADDWSDANCYPQTAITTVAKADGDTWIFNETNTGAAVTTYAPSTDPNITKAITVSTRYGAAGDGVKLERTSGGTLLTINPDTTATCTINDIIFSSVNITTQQLNLPAGAVNRNIVLNRPTFIGSGAPVAINLSQESGSLKITDTKVQGSYSGNIFLGAATSGANGPMTVTVDGLEFDNVSLTSSGGVYGFLLRKGNFASVCNATVKRVTGTVTCTNATGYASVIEVQGFNTAEVVNSNFTLTSTATAQSNYGIKLHGKDAANMKTDNPRAWNNTVNFNCPAGDAISIGQDAETGVGWTTNGIIAHNTAVGIASTAYSPHGCVLRGVASGKMYANKIRRFHSPIMLSLCTNDAVLAYGNLITDVYGVGLSAKGNSGGIFANNTVIVTPNSIDGSVTLPYGQWAREQGATNNTAVKFYNNNIIWLGVTKSGMFALVGAATNAATFSNNNYYADLGPHATAWAYQGVNYATLSAWNTAQETTDATANPMFSATIAHIKAAFGNLSADQLATPAAYRGGGQKWWTGVYPDTAGEPLSPLAPIDIGIGSKTHPFHPNNL